MLSWNLLSCLIAWSWHAFWQIMIQSQMVIIHETPRDYMWKHVLNRGPLRTWMRVIPRKCNASKTASDICTQRLLQNSNQNHRIRVFFFVNLGFESPRRWESNCWEWWIYRKSFSFHSVKFAPFWQNLGRQAHVQCIPFWGDPNFLPCKTSRIASSFLQIFTQPCVIPVTQQVTTTNNKYGETRTLGSLTSKLLARYFGY